MEEPSLTYNGTTGYVVGSETSAAHAAKEGRRAGEVQQAILECLSVQEATGRTCSEIEGDTGMKHQSISSAMRNLERDGKVQKTTYKRHGSYVYVSAWVALRLPPEDLLAPTPDRISWKTKYFKLNQALMETIVQHKEPYEVHVNEGDDGFYLNEEYAFLYNDIENLIKEFAE